MNVLLDGLTDVCLSGGALGSDLQWGMTAGKLGHYVIHWSFAGHNTVAPSAEVVALDAQQLLESAEAVRAAAIVLKKQPPVRSPTRELIQRNYFQVAWSQSLYGVGEMVGEQVQGGTSWAVAMFINRNEGLPCYFFEQNLGVWVQWNYELKLWETSDPPQPRGIWAGIGTRDLNVTGKNAIRKLMDYTPGI